MPKLTIDGREIEVPAGTRLIEAAKKLGIKIPHYCYHEALSIAGSCRMCLVEIEKMPKLAIACHTIASDGMVVHTQSDAAKKARAAMLELLLANHPLDCPVCDQAGECKLQQYYMTVGQYESVLLDGKIKKTKILRSIPELDKAAIDAVKQWVYEPKIIDGKPRGVIFTVTVVFKLK